jgi:hypothetical protein
MRRRERLVCEGEVERGGSDSWVSGSSAWVRVCLGVLFFCIMFYYYFVLYLELWILREICFLKLCLDGLENLR